MSVALTAAVSFLAGFGLRFGVLRTLIAVNRWLAAQLKAERLASGADELGFTMRTWADETGEHEIPTDEWVKGTP